MMRIPRDGAAHLACAVEIADPHKSLVQLEVLKETSLEARDGNVVRLIGSSGSDKSTLLHHNPAYGTSQFNPISEQHRCPRADNVYSIVEMSDQSRFISLPDAAMILSIKHLPEPHNQKDL